MRDEKKASIGMKLVRMIPLVLVVVLATIVVVRSGPAAITAYIQSYRDNVALTLTVIMALFLFKSVSFGLPYTVLYLAVGHLFPLPVAMLVNVVGIAVNMQIPYFVGRYGHFSFIERAIHKAPFVQRYSEREEKNPLVFSFFVKFIGIVPHEITNLLLGTLKIPYFRYLAGGILGLLPGMIATTVAGCYMTDPRSLQFILAVIAFFAVLFFSYYLSRRMKKS
ncbi:MAG: VTT domain-containing protein [Sphaerochaeta sp.]|jgi:uncharacterized membrane protein YdjX (TVP38/TMEM64 family)|nr:VTT domain-containing protein [Sphaerochaeta sp.]